MNQLKALMMFLSDLWIRWGSKSPKFYVVVNSIAAALGLIISAALGVNEMFSLGWGLIMIFGKISLTYLLSGIVAVLGIVFATGSTTISQTSKNIDKLHIKDKVNENTNQ